MAAIADPQLTATPTRTPRPITPVSSQVAPPLVIVAPAGTPTAAPVPTSLPTPTGASPSIPAELADVVAHYGMDPARRFIVVDIETQRMTVWDPDQAPRVFPISTGDETRGYRTPPWYGLVGRYWGTFHAFGVYADHGWYLYEDAGSILIHGAPYQLVDGQKLYRDLEALGAYPASRGCIRLKPEDALWLTEWNPQGVPLAVVPRN